MKRLLPVEPALFRLGPFLPTSHIEMKALNRHQSRPMLQGVSLPFALAIDSGECEIWIRLFRSKSLVVYVVRGQVPISSPVHPRMFRNGVWEVPGPICEDCSAYDNLHFYKRIAYNEEAFQQVLHTELPECCQDEAQNVAFFKANGHRFCAPACFNGSFRFNEMNMDVWREILSYLFYSELGWQSWFYRMQHGSGCVDYAFRTFLYSLSVPNYERRPLYLCDITHGCCVGSKAMEMMEEIRQVVHI